LSEIDPRKADWITTLSLAFMHCRGYFVNEENGELELRFDKLSNASLTVLIRDHQGSEDADALFSVLIREEYSFVKERIHQLNGDDRGALKMIDCGGQNGTSSLYFKLVFPQATIVRVEPAADALARFGKTIRANQFDEVYPVEGCIWEKDGRLELRDLHQALPGPSPGSGAANGAVTPPHAILPGAMPAEAGDPLERILAAFAWPAVDLLQVDARGAEALLDQPAMLHRTLRFTRMILFERPFARVEKDRLEAVMRKAGLLFAAEGDHAIAWRTLPAPPGAV